MLKFANEVVHVSLTVNDLKNICGNRAKVILFKDLGKYNGIQQMFGDCPNVILFSAVDNAMSGHFSALLYHSDTNVLELFDSFGFDCNSLFRNAVYDREQLKGNNLLQMFVNICVRYDKVTFQCNTAKLQSQAPNMDTCGRYSAIRCRLRDLSLKEFVTLFQKNKSVTPDQIVSLMTCLYTETDVGLIQLVSNAILGGNHLVEP